MTEVSARTIEELRETPGRTMDGPWRRSAPEPFEPKWPAWKVTLFVVTFCGAFWAAVIYLAMRLLG
ncbi:MAG: hypothetical protein R3C52_02130 [Hyphomonadaceae bacterium]